MAPIVSDLALAGGRLDQASRRLWALTFTGQEARLDAEAVSIAGDTTPVEPRESLAPHANPVARQWAITQRRRSGDSPRTSRSGRAPQAAGSAESDLAAE